MAEEEPTTPKGYLFDQEQAASAGVAFLTGIDEAGRGPLAGPVVIAGVILPQEPPFFPVDDSKKLTPAKREELANALRTDSRVKIAVSVKSAKRIDEINILHATHEGMREVALELNAPLTLVDGSKVPNFPGEVRFIVKGDAKSASIGAASIIAKTVHDQILREMDTKYPQYGFAIHMGYPTQQHIEAIQKYGLCPEHRRSFSLKHPKEDPNQLELPF